MTTFMYQAPLRSFLDNYMLAIRCPDSSNPKDAALFTELGLSFASCMTLARE